MNEIHYEHQLNYNGSYWVMKVHPCGYREFIIDLGAVSVRRAADYIDMLNYDLENGL